MDIEAALASSEKGSEYGSIYAKMNIKTATILSSIARFNLNHFRYLQKLANNEDASFYLKTLDEVCDAITSMFLELVFGKIMLSF